MRRLRAHPVQPDTAPPTAGTLAPRTASRAGLRDATQPLRVSRLAATDALATICLLLLAGGLLMVGPYPVTNDGGSHVYTSVVLRSLWAGNDPVFRGFAELGSPATPNWGVPVLLAGLMPMGPGLAGRLMMVLAVAVGTLGIASFARQAGVGRQHALGLGFLLASNWFVWAGFWGFALAGALAFAALGIVWRTLGREPRAGPLAVVAGSQLAGVFFHPMPALFLAFTGGTAVLLDTWRHHRPWRATTKWLCALATGPLLVAWFAATRVASPGARSTFVSGARELLESVALFPMDAWETWRWPHADGQVMIGIGALLFATAVLHRFPRPRAAFAWHPLVLCAALLLVVRLVVNDAQLGGAFVDSRLGFFAWSLLLIWAFAAAPSKISHAALLLMLGSSVLGTAMQLRASARAAPTLAQVVGDAQAAGLQAGATLVRLRYPAPAAHAKSGLDRARLPYALTHAVDWAAAETRARHLTNYELLGEHFAVLASGIDEATRRDLLTFEELSPDHHLAALGRIMPRVQPDFVAVVGEPPPAVTRRLQDWGYRPARATGEHAVTWFARERLVARDVAPLP